jgi:hypothetical protein
MSSEPIAKRRGCEWDDFGNSISLIAVRASASDVANALSKHYRGTVEKVDPSKSTEHADISNVVFQHTGQEYSVFASTDMRTDVASNVSKAMKTRVLCLSHEDTAGWTECRIFDAGENVETYTFGPDYADEMETMAEELGEDSTEMMPTDQGKAWDHRTKEDENDFLFRSELRKVDADSITDSDKMVNQAVAFIGAWIPGWAHFPFSNPSEYPGEAKSEFIEALRVKPG